MLQSLDDSDTASRRYLFGGVLTATVASACCLGPFALLALGVSGAWVGKLMFLDAYRPVFALLVLIFFILAGLKIFSSAANSNPGSSCAAPRQRRRAQLSFVFAGAIALILLGSEYWIPLLA